MAGNTNVTDRIPARVGLSTTECLAIEDFPAPAGGVITLFDGVYEIKGSIVLPAGLVVAPGATVEMISVGTGIDLTYPGTGTLFSSVAGGFLILTGMVVRLSGDGARLFDVDGPALLVDRMNASFTGVGQSLGISKNNQIATSLRSSVFTGFQDGLSVANCPVLILESVGLTSNKAGSLPLFSIAADVHSIQAAILNIDIGPTESIWDFNPMLDGLVVIERLINESASPFFTPGVSGPVDSVLPANVNNETINSVTDSGGAARFNFTGPAPVVGAYQEVTIVGYTLNPDYNGTFIVTEAGLGYFVIGSITYGSNEGGGDFSSLSVLISSTAHGQSAGTSLLITGTVDYDGGAVIYDPTANTFRINRVFAGTRSGQWNTGGLTETDRRVIVRSSPPQKSSANIGSVIVIANTVPTEIMNQNVYVNLNLGGIAVQGTNSELWVLANPITGELVYEGLAPFNGILIVAMFAFSSGSTEQFQFQAVKNGVPLPDGVISSIELSAVGGNLGLLSPITAVTGDRIWLQVRNVDFVGDVTVSQMSLSIS